jgi:hypothetical protein
MPVAKVIVWLGDGDDRADLSAAEGAEVDGFTGDDVIVGSSGPFRNGLSVL